MAEMDYHLSDDTEVENSRNGYGRKSVSTGTEKIEIAVPRDRAGSFDPQLIAKRQRRFPGFDDKIITHYHSDSGSEVVTARSRPLRVVQPGKARHVPWPSVAAWIKSSVVIAIGTEPMLCTGGCKSILCLPQGFEHLPQSHLASHPSQDNS